MCSYPLDFVLFWLAVTLMPSDTVQFVVKGPSVNMAWTRQENRWSASADRSLWSIDGTTVAAVLADGKGVKVDVGEHVKGVQGHDWKKSSKLTLAPTTAIVKDDQGYLLVLDDGAAKEQQHVIEYRRRPPEKR